MARRSEHEAGTALIETALIMPVVLLILIGIFEVGRAYQTWQVLTNAAREGARASVIQSADEDTVEAVVKQYMTAGQLPAADDADIDINRSATLTVNGTTVGASQVTVDYPFEFVVLQPIARLVVPDTHTGDAITMRATSLMRNEAQ